MAQAIWLKIYWNIKICGKLEKNFKYHNSDAVYLHCVDGC